MAVPTVPFVVPSLPKFNGQGNIDAFLELGLNLEDFYAPFQSLRRRAPEKNGSLFAGYIKLQRH